MTDDLAARLRALEHLVGITLVSVFGEKQLGEFAKTVRDIQARTKQVPLPEGYEHRLPVEVADAMLKILDHAAEPNPLLKPLGNA
jgi:hypothetical protein